ncbi:MAG: cytochrome c biogenesis protein CcdA [Gemmatimonadetes bacterium]|nr:cytochrome c biogenesis protein CcdA [Gemmatimonadota bacterium]
METPLGISIALAAGVLSFLSPCVLPLVPSYLSFVTGMNLAELEDGSRRGRVLTHAALFVCGFTAVFMLLGASASFLGQFVRAYETWIARAGGLLLAVLGLHLLGVFRINALMRERRVHLSDKPEGLLGTLAVGAAFGAGWTPCIGPVLGGIMTLAAARETVWSGTGLLLAYSVGLALPFLLAAVALDRFLVAFRRFRVWIPWVERLSGLLLLALGLLLMSGKFAVLSGWLVRFTPSWVYERI